MYKIIISNQEIASRGLYYNGSHPKEIVANVGEKVQLKCETAISYSSCLFKSSSGKTFEVSRLVCKHFCSSDFGGRITNLAKPVGLQSKACRILTIGSGGREFII